MQDSSETDHTDPINHGRSPADINTFIDHSHKEGIWVRVDPVQRSPFWVAHSDGGAVAHISSVFSQRSTV